MTTIDREPDGLAKERFDIIIVGGGIYGACLLLEASRRGIKSLLIERDDFGGATSLNSLRIVHGGLRYLQTADLPRFRRSVAEQAWWLKNFPEQVERLSCLMPLYNCGFRRPSVVKWALRANDYMAASLRKTALGADFVPFKPGRVIGRSETRQRFPQVNMDGLTGSALWEDAKMASPQRLLMEILRWSTSAGGKAINYMACTGFQLQRGKVVGVTAKCDVTSNEYEFSGRHVVNCAGPWAKELSSTIDGSHESHRNFASAFNLVIDRRPLSSDALALTPPIQHGATYFAVPYQQRMMVGTVHLPPNSAEMPSRVQVEAFLRELNLTVPGLDLSYEDVVHILVGRLPPAAKGSHLPSKSPKIRHHELRGSRIGITSIEGVKYTTARCIAERTLREIYLQRKGPLPDYLPSARPIPAARPQLGDISSSARDLRIWMREESVVHIDDLILRRCDLIATKPDDKMALGKRLLTSVGWDHVRTAEEIDRLEKATSVRKTEPC